MRQLALSTSPPTMILDRSSDGGPTVETLNLVGSTSRESAFGCSCAVLMMVACGRAYGIRRPRVRSLGAQRRPKRRRLLTSFAYIYII